MRNSPEDPELERRLEGWARAQRSAGVSPEIQGSVRKELAASLAPVKPIGSQARLVAISLAIFAAGAATLIVILDKAGFHLMSSGQIAGISAILLAGAVLMSFSLAHQMVPGSRRLLPPFLLLALTGLGVIAGIALLFPWRVSAPFAHDGWPCAVLEAAVVVPAAVAFWLFARRGALFASAGLGAAIGGLAVLLALMAIQFQCMFPQASHLLVWHVGVAAVLIGLSALIGWRKHA